MKGSFFSAFNWRDSRLQTGMLAALTIGCWVAGDLWPQWLARIGISDYSTRYLDSYAILASLDAVRAGADPHGANPLDPLMRGHVYSDWWLALHWLGLSRADNFILGSVWVGVFGLVAWITARPRNWGEIVWVASVLVSPPVMLAVKRANNDLVIFVVLAGCGLAATAPIWWRQLIAVGCLGLATGLKYFPAPGAMAFLWIRPERRMPAVLLAALLAAGLALASVWPQIDRGRLVIGSGVYTMGAPLLLRDLGWQDGDSGVLGVLVIFVGASVLVATRVTTGLATQQAPAERLRAALGAIVLLTCFVVGMNYAYRWVFVVWPAFWLWRQSLDGSLPRLKRRVARLGCTLVALCLWLDGGFCLTVNSLPFSPDESRLQRWQFLWRLWTQPVYWLLMILFAGWLLEGALQSVKGWWNLRHEP